jgi:basic amino acid/polyamine antiporter, APA family
MLTKKSNQADSPQLSAQSIELPQRSQRSSNALRSELGTLQLFTFGFGTIVGIGWVVLMGQLLAQAGLAGAFLGLTIGASMMALVALCYAEIGAESPLVGGEVVYAREIYGPKTSYQVGWFLLLSCLLICGFEMVSVGWIVTQLWPQLARTRLYSILGDRVYLEPLLVSLAVQAMIAAVNYRGVRGAGILQAVTTGFKIALSVCFILAGLRVANFAYSRPLFVSNATGSMLPGIVSIIAIAPFWFSGFNAISQALGERARGVSAARAASMIVVSLAAAWVFYSLVLVSMSLIMPRKELLSHSLPTAAAFQAAFGSQLTGNIVLFAGLLGLVSTWNALFFSATRILFVLAKDGFVGVMFRGLHPRFGTPAASIILVGLLIPIVALFGKGVISPLLSLSSIVMAGIYAMVCLGVIILRRRAGPQYTSFSAFRNLVPYLALTACLVIAVFASLEPLRTWYSGRWPLEWITLLAWGAGGMWLARKA